MSKITSLYLRYILNPYRNMDLHYILNPYRDMDKETKRVLWLLILLLGSFTTISLKPSLLNRPLGLKSI